MGLGLARRPGRAVGGMSATPGISDEELLRRAVTSARGRQAGSHPRWVAVMHVFELGSGYARGLCKRFGLNPDEAVRRK